MGNNKKRSPAIYDLAIELLAYKDEPKWKILFYSENPDGTISLTLKDNREAFEAHMKGLADESQEAANDNNN